MSDEPMAYVGFAKCGCAVAATVDLPEPKDATANTVAEFIKDGLTVERRTIAWVRENLLRCEHES